LRERILAVDRPSNCALVIEVTKKAMPFRRTCSEIEEAIQSGGARIQENDLWVRPVPVELDSRHLAIRDRAWVIIGPIVSNGDPFSKEARAAAIREANKITAKKCIYALLRRYWQGGQTKNRVSEGKLVGEELQRLGRSITAMESGPKSDSQNPFLTIGLADSDRP
jgi:hypothetical protein